MGIHARSFLARANVLLVALTLSMGVVVGVATPAHADADNVDNHLCLDTGFGYYGVTDHVHITDTTGTYHVSAFGQASAFTYSNGSTYCYQTSANLGCTTWVAISVYEDGNLIGSTPYSSGIGYHTVSTGNHSYGTTTGTYLVESDVITDFGNNCTSEAFGSVSTSETT